MLRRRRVACPSGLAFGKGGRLVRKAKAIRYLHLNWGEVYRITVGDARCTAQARFGSHDVLIADGPVELLSLMRRHYPGSTCTQ